MAPEARLTLKVPGATGIDGWVLKTVMAIATAEWGAVGNWDVEIDVLEIDELTGLSVEAHDPTS